MRNIDSCVNFLKSFLFLTPEKSADRRPSALRTCTWIVPWVDFAENHFTSSQPTPLPWPTPCRSKITFVSVSFHFIQCYYIFRDNLLFCFCTACTPGGCDGKEEVQIALSVHCSRIVWFAKNMPKSSHQVLTKIWKVSYPHLPSLYRLPQVVGHLRCHACQIHLHTVRAQKRLLAHCNYML